MATVNTAGARSFPVTATNVYNLGDVGPRGGSMTIQLDNSGATFSVTVVGRARGATNWRLIPYTSFYLNGAVGTGGVISTAHTGNSLFQVVVGDGMDIGLDFGSISGGTVTVFSAPSS